MLKKILSILISISLSGVMFADEGSTKPEDKAKKDNYGQQRSAEVNKGQQGERMKEQNAEKQDQKKAQNEVKKNSKEKAKDSQKKAQKKTKKQTGKK